MSYASTLPRPDAALPTQPPPGHALRKTAPGPGIELVPALRLPPPARGEVLLDVAYAGVCGTDLHVDDWYAAYHFMAPHLPVTLGHEFSAVVRAVGPGVDTVRPGDRVVVRPSVTCGRCAACQAAEHDRCTDRRGIGLTRDGAFAPQVLAPARNCLPLPPALRTDVAALAEPFSIAWQAVTRAQAAGHGLRGARVLVLGPGIIGQAIALLARDRGARVAVVGKDDTRRCALLRELGFQQVADLAHLHEQAEFEGWPEFELCFEATGAPESITHALDRLAVGAAVVVTGIHPRPLHLDLTALVRRQHTLIGSFRPPERVWPEVLQALLDLQDQVRPLITHTLPLAQAQHAFDLAHGRLAGKVLLTPDPDTDAPA